MDLRMKYRQNCQGDPWQRMSPAKKERWGRPLAAPTVPFAHPLPFPLHFCLHFIRRSMVDIINFSNANASANAITNANAMLVSHSNWEQLGAAGSS